MEAVSREASFIVWGSNYTPYGPVELGKLKSLVQNCKVTADTWVYTTEGGAWLKAAHVPELRVMFRIPEVNADADAERVTMLVPSELRRIEVLSDFSDEQLERFRQYLQVRVVPQFTVVIKQGEPGDTMLLVYLGELSVRAMTGGKEVVLATLGDGEFFGDISLFDPGPRSADVVASKPSTLLAISAAAFNKLAKDAPDIATPFLLAIGKTLTARIRTENSRGIGPARSQKGN